MSQKYREKVIIGRTDDGEGVVVFAIHGRGSWDEHHIKSGELTETVRNLVENFDYAPEDIQNGATEEDVREHSDYLRIFPPVEEEFFDGLLKKFKATNSQN